MDNALVREFAPRTLDKVMRLLGLLEEIDDHPSLRGKFVLHGGTAINLFMLDIPRLSVDIDLSYVGALSRDEMLAERPAMERGIREVALAQGYAVSGGEGEHAGRTFVLQYGSAWGSDHVKIDCVYMNRSPLLPIFRRHCPLMPDLDVPMFSDVELMGGKVKAFYDRVKVRDLYDVGNLKLILDKGSDAERRLAHKAMVYYSSLSATFPHGFESRPERFLGLRKDMEEQLHPMLRHTDVMPSLDSLIASAHDFIKRYVLPCDEQDCKYLELFAKGVYRPDLLFESEGMARAAELSPAAQWKLLNIRKMANR